VRGSGFLCLPAPSDPPVERLDRFADALGDWFRLDVGCGIHARMSHLGLVKLRIAKGVPQTELARRVGITQQVISRHEESDCQIVGIGRLQGGLPFQSSSRLQGVVRIDRKRLQDSIRVRVRLYASLPVKPNSEQRSTYPAERIAARCVCSTTEVLTLSGFD
jgi:hypothetical protein